MARFSMNDAEHYGGQGGGGYFSLKDDHDVATVRFLYDSVEDVEGYAVHEVELDGKKRYVNCLRAYNEPMDNCPFCKARMFQQAKLFVPIYNEDADKVQIWERGKSFFSALSGTLSRYDKKPIVSQTFEIERFGKKGDTKTQYQIFRTEDEADDRTLEDFDLPVIIGGLVLDKSADDMEVYLETGSFPPEDDAPSRRSSRRAETEEEPRRRSSRRTPSNSF